MVRSDAVGFHGRVDRPFLDVATTMGFLDDLLAGGPDYRVSRDLGGAVFAPTGDTQAERAAFQAVAQRIIANEGLGYRVRLGHRNSDDASGYYDRIIINIR